MKRNLLIVAILFPSIVSFSQEIKKIRIADLEKIISESKTPLIINFWATFCIPCIEEIPYFQRAVKRHESDGVKLLLVSLDLKEDYVKIRPFAAKRKFTANMVWLNESNADYFIPKIDSTWSGSLPATLFVNNKSRYRKFYGDQIKEEQLEKEIMAILGKKY